MQEIHYAAARGDLDTVLEELQNGADVNHRNPNYTGRLKKVLGKSEYTPLICAAGDPRADCEMLELLIKHGADLNIQSGSVETCALGLAIRNGQVEKTKFLLSKGADIYYVSPCGFNAWLDAAYCCTENKEAIFDFLLELPGLKIRQKSRRYGENVCKRLSMRGEFKLLQKVLVAGADRHELRWSNLMREVVLGTVDSVKMELPESSLKSVDCWERDAWLLSAVVGCIEKAEALLEIGADPCTTDRMGKDALHIAAELNHHEMVRWLLDMGMNINSLNAFGHTPLIEACKSGSTEAVKILLANGADTSLGGSTYSNIVSTAANLECFRLLIDYGEDINSIPGNGHLLKTASRENDIATVSALLEMGMNPDLTFTGDTALHSAIYCDYFEIAKLLLDAGANPDQQDVDGWSTFHHCNSKKAIQFLLENGADPYLPDDMGDTVAYHLEKMGRPDLANYLIQRICSS